MSVRVATRWLVVIEHHPDVPAAPIISPSSDPKAGSAVASGPLRAAARSKTPTGQVLREVFRWAAP